MVANRWGIRLVNSVVTFRCNERIHTYIKFQTSGNINHLVWEQILKWKCLILKVQVFEYQPTQHHFLMVL